LHSLCKVVQQLQWEGLTGADLLQTFFSHWVQPLHQQVTTMWMYPRPRCPDHSFSEELGDAEMGDQHLDWIHTLQETDKCSSTKNR
jgi:hypothetical protein